MRAAERLVRRAAGPHVRPYRLPLVIVLVLFIFAHAAAASSKKRVNIVFTNSCRDNHNDDKVEALWQALSDHPTAGAYNTLGVLYAAAGSVSCAIPAFESALGLDPDNWESHYDLALALITKGEAARAARELRSAIQQKPDSAAA